MGLKKRGLYFSILGGRGVESSPIKLERTVQEGSVLYSCVPSSGTVMNKTFRALGPNGGVNNLLSSTEKSNLSLSIFKIYFSSLVKYLFHLLCQQ